MLIKGLKLAGMCAAASWGEAISVFICDYDFYKNSINENSINLYMKKSDGSHRNYNKETENIDSSLRKSAAKVGFYDWEGKRQKNNNYNPLCKNLKGLIDSFLAGGSNKHVTFEHWVWRKFEKQELGCRFPQKRRWRQSTKERPLRESLMKPPHTVEKDVACFSFRTEVGGGLFCPRAGTERPLKTETSATQPHWVEKIFMTPLSDLPAGINIISISMVWTRNKTKWISGTSLCVMSAHSSRIFTPIAA